MALTLLLLVGGERNLETSRDSVIRTRFEADKLISSIQV
jgi:hypothetical protein